MFYNRQEATSMIGLTGEIIDSDCSGFDFCVCLCDVHVFWGPHVCACGEAKKIASGVIAQIPSTLFTETDYPALPPGL